MQIRKIVYSFQATATFLIMTIFLYGCNFSDNDASLWEELSAIENQQSGKFKVHNLHRTQSGALIAVGYFKKDQYDCGLLNALSCSLFEIYRSLDGGESWEDVSDTEIAQRHAFINDDKVKGRKLPIRHWLKYVKDAITPIIYSDQGKITFISSDEDNIFLYVDGFIYVSADEGKSWTDYTGPDGAGPGAINRDSPFGLFESHLVFRGLSGHGVWQSVYRRGKDGIYQEINLYENRNKKWNQFAIFYPNSGAPKLIPPGKKLSGNYYLEYERMTQKKNEGPTYKLDEIYETPSGAFFTSIVQSTNEPLGAMDQYWYLWKSTDQGDTFSKVILYGGDDETLYDQVKIYGSIGNCLLLRVSERRKKFLKPGEGNLRKIKYYLFETKTGHLASFVFPASPSLSIDEAVNFAIDSKNEAIYLSIMDGIYKTKKGYSSKVLNEKKYQRSAVAPDQYSSKEIVSYELSKIFSTALNCSGLACIKNEFPEDHFEFIETENENPNRYSLKLKPRPSIWISKVKGEPMIFRISSKNKNSTAKLIVEQSKGGDAILEQLKKDGFSITEERFVNQSERLILQKENQKHAILLEKKSGDEDLTYLFEMNSNNEFLYQNIEFTTNFRLGKEAPSKPFETGTGLELGVSLQKFESQLKRLFEKDKVFKSQGVFFLKKSFSGSKMKLFAKKYSAMLAIDPHFTSDGQLYKLGLFCYSYPEDKKKKGYKEALYTEITKDYDNFASARGYKVFRLKKVSHYIKDNAYIRISNLDIPLIEFIDLSKASFDVPPYNEPVEVITKE